MNETQVAMARTMLADRERPIAEICAALRISKATLYRYLPASSRT
jgi:AcrR family transcriptional regulator